MRQKRKYPVGARLYIKLRETSCTSRRSFPQDAPRVHRHLHNVGRGDIYDLHASAKLGERRLDGDQWLEWSNQVIPHILARARRQYSRHFKVLSKQT
ncbi:MAG TPA: hypothetical protein VIH75_15430 [Candidatus Sulfotelmatobacter sp.]